jgi:hypothetical protein
MRQNSLAQKLAGKLLGPRCFQWVSVSWKRDRTLRALACALNGCCSGGRSVRRPRASSTGPVGLFFRQLALQSRPMFGSLSLKNWPCLPGPAGPPIASRSASEPLRAPPPGWPKTTVRPAVGAPWFSGPAGAVALAGRDRGRSQSLAAARLTLTAPSGSESAPRAMRNFGSFW